MLKLWTSKVINECLENILKVDHYTQERISFISRDTRSDHKEDGWLSLWIINALPKKYYFNLIMVKITANASNSNVE